MRQAGRTQAYLRQLQAIAHLHQAVFVGNKHVVKANFAMTAMLFGAHDGYAPHNLPARIVFMEQKSRQPLAGIVRSAGDEDEMRCGGGASNEVLDAIDDPMVALRSEEHTSELQSLMRISYAVF